jgi:hypothetical protein
MSSIHVSNCTISLSGRYTYLFTYLLTLTMEQCPPWEANRLAASKKFPAFYETRRFITAFTSARHLSLSWASSIQSITATSHFLKIHLNIILPSTPGSPQCSLFFRFPHQNPLHASPHTRYMPRPSLFLDFITRTILGEEYRSLSSEFCFLHSLLIREE